MYENHNFIDQNYLSSVGSMNQLLHGGSLFTNIADTIPAYQLYKHLRGNGYTTGLIPPPDKYIEGDGMSRGSPIFGGELPPNPFIIPVDTMQHQMHLYKRMHGLPMGKGLPTDHVLHLLARGAKMGTKGGFLPFGALLPLLGTAASTLGPTIAGAATTFGLNKLFGGKGVPPLYYHKPSNSYVLHGDGWKDVFKSLLNRAKVFAKRAWNSEPVRNMTREAAKRAADKAREALERAATSMLERVPEIKNEGPFEDEGPSTGEVEDDALVDAENLSGLGLSKRRRRHHPYFY